MVYQKQANNKQWAEAETMETGKMLLKHYKGKFYFKKREGRISLANNYISGGSKKENRKSSFAY